MNPVKLPEWIGRISGLVISCLFPVLLAGGAMSGLMKNHGEMLWKFIPLLLIAILGYVLAWFKPKIGGAIVILGGMLMLDFHLLQKDIYTALLYGLPFIAVGGIFMLPGVREEEVKNPAKS